MTPDSLMHLKGLLLLVVDYSIWGTGAVTKVPEDGEWFLQADVRPRGRRERSGPESLLVGDER